MADKNSNKKSKVDVELDDQGRVILTDPELASRLQGMAAGSRVRRSTPIININCPCGPPEM
ncbi:hypothetical protein [Streptomyces sp. NPDC048349]|uniref:hypothetical protein n=1 Tax=Streptomyces sp. NPDC048349 TaxID=3155486 RepID=UPI003419F269